MYSIFCIFFCSLFTVVPLNRRAHVAEQWAVRFLSRMTYSPSQSPTLLHTMADDRNNTQCCCVLAAFPARVLTTPVRWGHRRRRLTRLMDKWKSRVGMRGVFFMTARARGVFGSMIKIKYDDYGGDYWRMRVLEVLSHVWVLVDTSRRVELQRSRLFIGRAAETPLTTHHCSWKVGNAATTHAHDRCARARTHTDTTVHLLHHYHHHPPPTDPILWPVTPPSALAITASTSLHHGCSSLLLCGAVMFSFRVYVPVYAAVVSVVSVLARTDYYYYYYY